MSPSIVQEEVAQRVSREKFVNWSGGEGKNIEGDKAKEICNCTFMSVVQGMGTNPFFK